MKLSEELKLLGNNTKGKYFLKAFRRSNFFTKNKTLRLIGFPYRLYYKVVFNYLLGIDIPDTLNVGFALNVFHGHSIVINSKSIIGNFVTIRQNTTIGNKEVDGGSPVISDHVNIGANVVIIGNITVGENAIIGAGSVVIHDVPKDVTVAGNPAKIIKRK